MTFRLLKVPALARAAVAGPVVLRLPRPSVPFRVQSVLIVIVAVASVSFALIAIQAQTIRNQVLAERTASIERVVAGLQLSADHAARSGGRDYQRADLVRRLPDVAQMIGGGGVVIRDSAGMVVASSTDDAAALIGFELMAEVLLVGQPLTNPASDGAIVHAVPFELAGGEHGVLATLLHLQPLLDAVAQATISSVLPSLLVLLIAAPLAAYVSNRILARAYEREQQLRVEARFGSLVRNSSDLLLIVSPDGRITYVSPSVERVLGFRQAEVQARKVADFLHIDDMVSATAFIDGAAAGQSAGARAEWRVRHRDGTWRDFELVCTNLLADASVGGLVLNGRDISERKALEEQLSHQAFHDPLTGLANRALFQDRVAQALVRAERHGTGLAVLFLDLDDFKTVNDSLGHHAGDRLLSAIAERLSSAVRASDTVARLGGDEFAILLEEVDEAELHRAAERVGRALRSPFKLEGQRIFVSASIGIAPTSAGLETTTELLRGADVAMYAAKNRGKGHAQLFEKSMQQAIASRLELDSELRGALERAELRVHYQPLVTLATGRLVGFEALVRWQHPERGLIMPDMFIGLAEDIGLIHDVGRFVLEAACRQAREWQLAYPQSPALNISVNLSAAQITHAEIVPVVAQTLAASRLAPESLVLEITESTLVHDSEPTLRRLLELKELGVRLAIDDFGTGYSSLSYLRRFPFDLLKIDKSFVEHVANRTDAMALTRAIVELGRSLGLSTVAEGVESAEQAAELVALGCQLAQGHHFGRAVAAQEVDALLARHHFGGSVGRRSAAGAAPGGGSRPAVSRRQRDASAAPAHGLG